MSGVADLIAGNALTASSVSPPADRARVGDYGVTVSGRQFWPEDPRIGDVDLEDLGYRVCRHARHLAGHHCDPLTRTVVLQVQALLRGPIERIEGPHDPLVAKIALCSQTTTDDARHGLALGMGRHEQAAQVRCIFGNVFRPVTFDESWRTSDAVALARGMYTNRDFSAMPILADALQDAGCDDEGVLNHCRGQGPHVRGCYVVDLVLNLK